jgi:hypothetical protein
MTIQMRCETCRLCSGAGMWLFMILVITPPTGTAVGDQTNWLQLRRLNMENQFKLRQQQMLRPKVPATKSFNTDSPLVSSKKHKIILPKMVPTERPSGYSNLERAQRLDQRRLQESQRRKQALANQRSRVNNSNNIESYKSKYQLQRFRQQQLYQLDRMRTQSLLNGR